MKYFTTFFLLLHCLCLNAQQPAEPKKQPELLKSNGLKSASIEETLPIGQIVHVRVNNVWKLLQDTEKFILTFIGKDMLPPNLKPFLDKPNPVLEFAGLNLIGQPLTDKSIEAVSGINSQKPLSISIFPNKDSMFIVSVPVTDHKKFSYFLANIVTARSFKSINTTDYSGTEIVCMNRSFPARIFVTCSDDYAFICASTDLLSILHTEKYPKMIQSEPVKKSIAQYGDQDLMAVFDMTFVHSFMQNLKRFENIPPNMIQSARQTILRNMSPQIRMRLMWQFGITDLSQSLDYVESFANASYSTAFKYLFDRLKNFKGMTLSFDIGSHKQKAQLTLFSKDIKKNPNVLNMDKLTEILGSIPGDKNSFSISAATAPESGDSPYKKMFTDILKSNFQTKNLKMKYYNLVAGFFKKSQPLQPLTSRTPWMISFPYSDMSIERPDSIEKGAEYLFNKFTMDSVMTVTKTDEKTLVKYYQDQARVLTENEKAMVTLQENFDLSSPYFIHENKVVTGKSGSLNKLTLESSYKTQNGIFGYHEHELINRKYLYYKSIQGLMFIERQSPGKWLTRTERLHKGLLNSAVINLLNQVPRDANNIEIKRILQDVDNLLEGMTVLETGLRKGIDDYLTEVNGILNLNINAQAKMSRVEAVAMPITVLSLNYNSQTNKCDVTLIGKLQYPRPVFFENITPLFEDYLKVKNSTGGSLVYESKKEGQLDLVYIQMTDGIASLIKTAVSKLAVQNPSTFMRKISAKGDGMLDNNTVLIYNPTWTWALNF